MYLAGEPRVVVETGLHPDTAQHLSIKGAVENWKPICGCRCFLAEKCYLMTDRVCGLDTSRALGVVAVYSNLHKTREFRSR